MIFEYTRGPLAWLDYCQCCSHVAACGILSEIYAHACRLQEFVARYEEHTSGYIGLVLVELPEGFESDDLGEAIAKQLESDQVQEPCAVAVVCAPDQQDLVLGAFAGLKTEEEVEHGAIECLTFLDTSGSRSDVVVAFVGANSSKLKPSSRLPHAQHTLSWPCLEENSPMGSVHCWFHEVVGNVVVDKSQTSVLGEVH